ncbi:MAG: DNA methyltransferase [Acidobacteriota bacterium]
MLNGEVHNWYRMILGFSDHLVADLLDEFKVEPGETVLDAFCGSGTTLVECMKRGIDAVGLDANPLSCFTSRVKTNWRLKSARLRELLAETRTLYRQQLRRTTLLSTDPTYHYLSASGMIDRGWISDEPLRKAIATKAAIWRLPTNEAYRAALLLALIAEVVGVSSNVKFGPELYCGPRKKDSDVLEGFARRVELMASDIEKVRQLPASLVTVIQGDARECGTVLAKSKGFFAAAISSPPYPTEHDYTRNTRLELAFLEAVSGVESLRAIKRKMIRSHTKNIYHDDKDSQHVAGHARIQALATELRKRVAGKKHGFARYYPNVVTEYFGGMKRHLEGLHELLAPGAPCALVVGDQASYQQMHIPTARLLASIAREIGFEKIVVKHWRNRWSTRTASNVRENILILRKPE